MARRRTVTKAEKLASLAPEVWGGMKTPELRKAVSTLRTGYTRRTGAFRRKGIVSQAQIMTERASTGKLVPLKKMTRQQLLHEYAKYSQFFKSETSTEEGVFKVNMEQDIRIFGKNESGVPNYRMTNEERQKYWSLYDEYMNMYPTRVVSSEQVQQILADALFSNAPIPQSPYTYGPRPYGEEYNFMDVLYEVEERMKESIIEQEESGPNVYRGRGVSR